MILTVSSHDRVENLVEFAGIGAGDAAYIGAAAGHDGTGVVCGCHLSAVCTKKAADIFTGFLSELIRINYAVLIRIIPRSNLNGSVVVDLVLVVTNICSIRFGSSAGDGAVVLADEAAYLIPADDLAVDTVDQGRSGDISRIFPDKAAYGAAAVNRTVIGQGGISNRSAVRTEKAAGDAFFLTAADNHAGIDQICVMDITGIVIENPRSAAVLCLYLAAVGNDQPIIRRII